MHHINGVYTQRFNRTHNTDGQLFRGRYKPVLVEGDSHLLEVMRYVHRNPMNAGLAKKLDKYLWTSHVGYMSSTEQWSWLHKSCLLEMLAVDESRRKAAYVDFVTQGEPSEITAFYSMKKLPSLMGSDGFKDWVKGQYHHLGLQKEVPEAQILAVTPQEIIEHVCASFNLEETVLKKSRRGVENLPRDIAIYLSRCYCQKTLTEIGEPFGINNYSTVSSAVERIKLGKKSDPDLLQQLEKLKSRIAKSQQ